jgi:flagellar hook protein FlgE
MSIDDQVGLVLSDLRRAAIPGATGDAADRAADVLVDAGAQTGVERFAPSTAPLAVAVDGPGFFVLRDGERTIYSRLGDFRIDESGRLVDGHGRTVVGFERASGGWAAAAMPIVVSAQNQGSNVPPTYRIDESGVLSTVDIRYEGRTRRRRETITPVARLAIALFPAPERLQRFGDAGFVATRAAGTLQTASPGVAGAGTLRAHVLAAGAVNLEGDLHKLWMLRRKAELDVALAGASDACVRTALGLVR